MTRKRYKSIGIKSSDLWDEDTDIWTYSSGKPMRGDDPRAFYGIVPTLFRAIDKRGKAISILPWSIMRGDTEYDTSDEYENNTGLISNMVSMLWMIEASIALCGKAYLMREQNAAGYDKIRYLDPNSITLDEKKAKEGELIFKRVANGQTKEYTTKEIIYIWPPDPTVEIGPPSTSAAGVALMACGVLVNLDEFARNYFGRGAIKAMIFAMQGAPKEEAEKFESWWNKFVSGIKNSFRTKVINAEKVEPVIVGEGIKELEHVNIADDKREEIALALDIPFSILFSNSANYATAQQDKLNWYQDFVKPEAEFIAACLNEQLYAPLGYKLVFKPETLDMFQEDEAARATSLGQLVTALAQPQEFIWAASILGYEIDDATEQAIIGFIAEKEARRKEMADRLQQNPTPETPPAQEPIQQPSQGPIEQPGPGKTIDLYKISHDLDIWKSKCLKALKNGEAVANVVFVTDAIPAKMVESIMDGLKRVTIADEVIGVFKGAACYTLEEEKPKIKNDEVLNDSGLFAVANELRAVRELLENGTSASA